MNIFALLNKKTENFSLVSDFDTEIIINNNDLKKFDITNFTESYDSKTRKLSRSMTVDGVNFIQDETITIHDKEYLVWAVLNDKIILKIISTWKNVKLKINGMEIDITPIEYKKD